MPTDLTVILVNRPGTLADAMESLGAAGINVVGAAGLECGGEGVFHVLVEDAASAREAVRGAGMEVRAEREVVVTPVEQRAGAGGEILRRIADAGANVDLIYLTQDGRLALGGGDVEAIRRALG